MSLLFLENIYMFIYSAYLYLFFSENQFMFLFIYLFKITSSLPSGTSGGIDKIW